MTVRRLLTSAATLALAVTGVAVPSVGMWDTPTARASAVVVSVESSPARAVTTMDTVQANATVPAPTRRRFRSRTTSHDPVAVVISLVLFALIAGGYYLFRYLASQGSAPPDADRELQRPRRASVRRHGQCLRRASVSPVRCAHERADPAGKRLRLGRLREPIRQPAGRLPIVGHER